MADVQFQPESEVLRVGKANGVSPTPRTGEYKMRYSSSTSEAGKKKRGRFILPLSVLALGGLDNGTTLGGQSTLLIPSIQMLISSRNTLRDTLRNNGQSGHAVASQGDT